MGYPGERLLGTGGYLRLRGRVPSTHKYHLNPVLEANSHELLAKILSSTRAAPLWLATALCGRVSWIKGTLEACMWHSRHTLDVAAWTGIAGSFMHLRPDRNAGVGMISRANVWRLRHDCHEEYPTPEDYSGAPRHGWPPFGAMRAEDTDLEIRSHLECSHQWNYASWTWLVPTVVTDAGYLDRGQPCCPLETPPPHEARRQHKTGTRFQPADEEAVLYISRETTQSTFNWCCHQTERGFVGNVVQPRRGSDRVLERDESAATSAREDYRMEGGCGCPMLN